MGRDKSAEIAGRNTDKRMMTAEGNAEAAFSARNYVDSETLGLETDVTETVALFFGCVLHGLVDDGSQRRQCAHGVGIRRVARQRERLAAASTKIDRLPRTASTRFLHPRVAAERLKCRRLLPDPAKRPIPHAVET